MNLDGWVQKYRKFYHATFHALESLRESAGTDRLIVTISFPDNIPRCGLLTAMNQRL